MYECHHIRRCIIYTNVFTTQYISAIESIYDGRYVVIKKNKLYLYNNIKENNIEYMI